MKKLIAGVDIGGTHVTVSLVDISRGKLINGSYVRANVDPSMQKAEIINAWGNAIRESFCKSGFTVSLVGIAMPGPFDYENGISFIKNQHKFEHLYGENVKESLALNLGIKPGNISLINDASAFLLGEISCGAGKSYQNIAGITLGTGLGSASIIDKKIYEGDLYKMPYKDGCAEDYISARWLINHYEELSNIKVTGVKNIADRFLDDDSSRKAFIEFGENLASVLIKGFERQVPEAIIIGGNISLAWNCFMPTVKKVLEKNKINYLIKRAELGEAAALIGGSYLWK
ncbi:MAG: ROK family protein [Ferruginibacter sp.]